MSSFKPMVKMYTDEPSVSLKLKKGGRVKTKHHKEHEEHGHKPMHHHAMGGMHHAFESESGKAPKKPSMSERRKAMNPNLYAKGGKVAHKLDGGMMPMGTQPMGRNALMAMSPQARMARAMQVRKMMTGMKKGGSADHKMLEKLEKELHHHESLDMAHAHHKKHGGIAHHAHGGKVHHVSGHPEGTMEHHKAMCKHYEKKCKEGGSAHDHKMLKHHKSCCEGGMMKKASGGEIDKDMTKTTIEGNAKHFVNNIHDGEHADHTSGKTGMVKLGNAGGYKHGGKTKHHYAKGGRATGSSIPSETNESETRGHTEMGGTIEGNEHYFEDTDMHTGRPFSGSKTTGGVRMGNAGGFKRGGKAHHMHHKADGGAIDKYETRNTVEGGNWENRPADTTPKGKTNTKTGEVKLANAGGFKHGGHAPKKAYATGGNVNAMGKPVAMPKHFVSRPVANSLQSGTFKKGGKVKFSDGGTEDLSKGAYDAHYANEKKENEAMRDAILGAPKRAYDAVKGMFSPSKPPDNSVTKTERSVTVTPAKKRGGRAR